MNLYELHNNPEQLLNYGQSYKLPDNAWQKVHAMSRKGIPTSAMKPYEKYIAKGDYSSYKYAHDIIGGRWPPGEQAIIDGHPNWAWKYADLVLNEPWPEAEATIFKDEWYAIKYKDKFGIPYNDKEIEFSN